MLLCLYVCTVQPDLLHIHVCLFACRSKMMFINKTGCRHKVNAGQHQHSFMLIVFARHCTGALFLLYGLCWMTFSSLIFNEWQAGCTKVTTTGAVQVAIQLYQTDHQMQVGAGASQLFSIRHAWVWTFDCLCVEVKLGFVYQVICFCSWFFCADVCCCASASWPFSLCALSFEMKCHGPDSVISQV